MWSGKCPVGEMSVRGNVLLDKCTVGKVSFGEVSGRGIVRSEKCLSGKCPLGKCQSGNCSHTIINVDKAHGRANIFIRMLKTFDSVTIEPIQSYLTV